MKVLSFKGFLSPSVYPPDFYILQWLQLFHWEDRSCNTWLKHK